MFTFAIFSGITNASTLVPIQVGDITIFVPITKDCLTEECNPQEIVETTEDLSVYEELDTSTPQILTRGSVGEVGKYQEDSLIVGTIPANQQVLPDGSFNYSVPIVTTEAVNGLKPAISVNYSSTAGFGVMGKGWSVGGISAIQRCGQIGSPVTFSQNDKFCFNGQKLVAVIGDYGEVGTEYRTEIDNFIKITSVGGSLGNPDLFIAEYTNGNTATYGGLTSTVLARNSDTNISWSIQELKDKFGNVVSYEYIQEGNSLEHHIANVKYTQNKNLNTGSLSYIKFNYIDGAQRSNFGYLNGETVRISKTLESIESHSDGHLIRSYSFTYNNGLLRDINACKENACLPKTVFEWDEGDSELSSYYSEKQESEILGEYNYKGSKIADV